MFWGRDLLQDMHLNIYWYLCTLKYFFLLYFYLQGGVLSTASPTPLVTQAAGLMQSSIAPVFRPPAGVHISHYPPNYIPYTHYFSPFYVPPPAIHQFLGNSAFPQQPQAGGVYPAPSAAAATGVKYSLPQYKPGTHTGNPAHFGMPSGYGPYSSPAGYNPSSTATAGNATSNEDLTATQFKESSVYISGQQVSSYFLYPSCSFNHLLYCILNWLNVIFRKCLNDNVVWYLKQYLQARPPCHTTFIYRTWIAKNNCNMFPKSVVMPKQVVGRGIWGWGIAMKWLRPIYFIWLFSWSCLCICTYWWWKSF